MVHVLVVEERDAVAESMIRGLRRQGGYDADQVSTGSEALETYPKADLVLLSLELPDIDGLEVCRSIRAVSDVPIIAIAGRDTELDRVLALQAGSDDCVTKTCGSREIMARIEAVMRRAYRPTRASDTISLCPLQIDRRSREVLLRGEKINVTAKEFDLLCLLATNPQTVVSRKELMATIWDNTWTDSSRTIDTHVSSLRGKLGASTWILTVRGVGYRMGHDCPNAIAAG
ncbi:response regulator transcription factor [Saccharothrix sp. 6-C]|uniref:DNA-binding response OmpR family regulator n=2 Tax=Saccharothrix TaxID=2071 RepID=A0A3N1H282_9PSEU|nr:response regulator transcription factor [Saccharothrix texasensis]QQQ80449.1 response regulator transcription factor [Saccharothrix sp. 6-C]ROP36568.1 DNA-binding response OmpR family regulator [Saccharothrix texasensis]